MGGSQRKENTHSEEAGAEFSARGARGAPLLPLRKPFLPPCASGGADQAAAPGTAAARGPSPSPGPVAFT